MNEPRGTPLGSLLRLGEALERGLGGLAAFCYRRAPLVSVVILAVTAIFVQLSSHLKIDTDLTRLLPTTFESVRDVKRLSAEFGGVGYVSVVVDGPDRATLERYAEDVAPKLAELPSVRYVDYKRPIAFFEDHALQYLDAEDLGLVRDRLSTRRDWEVSKVTGELLDEDEAPPPVAFDDLQAKYEKKLGLDREKEKGKSKGAYYASEDGKRIALLVKPAKLASDFGFAKQVVSDVERTLASVDLAPYGGAGAVKVELSGRYKKRVDLQGTLSRDLQVATVAAFALILLYVAWHFRRVVAVVLVIVPLVVTLVATYGFAALAVGSLNILTSFIGAILLGVAVDQGIHLLGRYDEERALGRAPEEALRRGFGEAGRASAAASLTNVGAFLCLTIADFKAFREFGVLAASGMLFTLVCYLTVLPTLLGIGARLFKMNPIEEVSAIRFARPVVRHARPIFMVMALLLVVAVARLPTARFNYDFAAIDEADLPSFKLDKEVNKLIGRSQTPLVVLAKDATEAEKAAAILRERAAVPGSTIDRVLTLVDLVPKDLDGKREVIADIGEVAEHLKDQFLDETQKRDRDRLVKMASASDVTRDGLPNEIARQFQRPGDTALADFVLVYPSVSMSDGRLAQRVADEVRGLALPDGTVLRATGEPMVLADILTNVRKELPVVFGLAFAQQFLLLWIFMGSFGRAVLTIFPALATMPLLAGSLSVTGLEFNYLNIILLPTLLGMGEDGGAHLVARVGTGEDLTVALSHTARATFGAAMTTMFGFGAMLLASHPGLRMFGEVAVLGIALNLFVCVAFLPALIAVIQGFLKKRGAAGPA